MFTSGVIETGLGLVFVFSLTAILVTQINTLITMFLNLRAKELKSGLSATLTDPQVRAKLLAHPIINLVEATVTTDMSLSEEEAEVVSRSEVTKTSYIAPSTFSEAMVGILISESRANLYNPLIKAVLTLPNSLEKSQLREQLRSLNVRFTEESVREVYNIVAKISDENYRKNLIAGLREVEASLEQIRFSNAEMIPLLDSINKIKDEAFKNAMNTLLATARTIDEAQIKLQNWFDDSMSRVSEAFTRRMQRISIAVALILSIILNVDAVFVGRTLWEDPELRRDVAAAATTYNQAAVLAQITKANAQLEAQAMAAEGQKTPTTLEDLQNQVDATQQTVQNLLDLRVPIGWEFVSVSQDEVTASIALGYPDPRNNPRNLWSLVPGNNSQWLGLWFQKIIGIIITTVAASQGAPFWFDLLNKIASRR